MSKALELLENIDKKYNEELKRTEERLEKGIEQTSETIKNSLHTRANTIANAIQGLDEKIEQSVAQSSKTIDSKLTEHQRSLESKLSRLQQLNEQIQHEEQKAHNIAVQKKLSILNITLISIAVILLIAILLLGYSTQTRYSELETVNSVILEKQATIDHLNKSGGSLNISTCTHQDKTNPRLCIQINPKAGSWQGGTYMVPMGY